MLAVAIETPPIFLGALDHLEVLRARSCWIDSSSVGSAAAQDGEGTFDGVGPPQVVHILGRDVVGYQQHVSISAQAGIGEFHDLLEGIGSCLSRT